MEASKDGIFQQGQTGFDWLDFMTEGIEQEKLLQFIGVTEMKSSMNLRVGGFWVTKRVLQTEFVKKTDLN